MRILVISDIHSNLTALESVLSHSGEIDAVCCLGDIVGYGPEPNECIQRVRSLPNLTCILGNHDAAVLKQIDSSAFNHEARQVIHWTQEKISEENLDFLRNLPERAFHDEVTLAHGSPRQPVWEYLLDTHNATISFAYFETPFCFVGHTHLPVLYQLAEGDSHVRLKIPEPNTSITLNPRAIINPGSVGQPRDRDARASFAIFDPAAKSWEYNRIPYDIPQVQERMQAAGLPDRHIQRLSSGW